MKKLVLFASFLALPIGLLTLGNIKSAQAISNAKPPIVLELFTSQSCSSCPSADKVLSEVAAENDNIIALSCNVTYWNHLHWKDTLSKEFCTSRQRHYVKTLSSRGPYTPQIVINGKHEMVGSRGSAVRRTIASDLKKAAVAPIDLTLSDNNLMLILPEIAVGNYTLLLVTHGDEHTQSIPSGENRGRTVSYTNPVENIVPLGSWNGNSRTLSEDISSLEKASGYVVLAQKNSVTGPIVAAGKL